MKRLMIAFAFGMASQAGYAQPNFHYSSGRLFEDPQTNVSIHSPYLAFYQKGELQWMAYDPAVREGRFVSVSSSYSTAVACGYVKGPLNFLENRVVTPVDEYTAVAVSVTPDQKLEWFYAHNVGIVPSKFHWVQKLRDGMTLVSGHEYTADDRTALLLRIDKTGEVTWSKRIEGEIGLEVHSTRKDRIFWMTSNLQSDELTLYELDQFTGDIESHVRLTGKTANAGIRASKSFYLSENELLIARISKEQPSKILVDQFSLASELIQSLELSYIPDDDHVFELQGVTRRPNGTIQLALNLKGSIAFANQDPIHTSNTKEILLVTLTASGQLEGVEKYGSQDIGVSGIYRVEDEVAITGSHRGEVKIQSQTLEYAAKSGAPQSYLVYLDEYDPMLGIEDLPLDPTAEIHELKIYPNPVTTQSTITLLNEHVIPGLAYEIRVYDNHSRMQSRHVGKTRFESSRDKLKVSSLSSGVFHVFVIQDETVIGRGKFIITR